MVQKLTYIQYSDYYIPDIRLAHTGTQTLGKYGKMRRTFLEQNKLMLFNDMVLTETLFPHLWEVQQTCEKRMNLMRKELCIHLLKLDSIWYNTNVVQTSNITRREDCT